jgi:programmed cell death protein 5
MNPDELKKYQEQLQQQQAEVFKKAALFKYLTKEARERLNRIKVVRPELAGKVELALLQAVQLGQINGIITDTQLKNILTEVTEKKQMRILRR